MLRDDESDAAVSRRIYEEYVADGRYHALLGPYSSPLTEAAIEVTDSAGMVLVAPMAADPGIWAGRSRRWGVQMLNPGPTYLQGSVELAAGNGATRAALVYEESQFPASVAEGVREAARTHGMDIVLDRAYPPAGADHEGLATAAREAGAELLIGGGYLDDAIAFTRAVAAVDYTPMLLSLNLGPAESAFADEVGDLARCVAGNAAWLPTISTTGYIVESRIFVRRYELLLGTTPSYYAAGGFGAVELLAEAMEALVASGQVIEPATVRDHLFSAEPRPCWVRSRSIRWGMSGRALAGAEGAAGAVAGRWGGRAGAEDRASGSGGGRGGVFWRRWLLGCPPQVLDRRVQSSFARLDVCAQFGLRVTNVGCQFGLHVTNVGPQLLLGFLQSPVQSTDSLIRLVHAGGERRDLLVGVLEMVVPDLTDLPGQRSPDRNQAAAHNYESRQSPPHLAAHSGLPIHRFAAHASSAPKEHTNDSEAATESRLRSLSRIRMAAARNRIGTGD